jgi:hypothetical protein
MVQPACSTPTSPGSTATSSTLASAAGAAVLVIDDPRVPRSWHRARRPGGPACRAHPRRPARGPRRARSPGLPLRPTHRRAGPRPTRFRGGADSSRSPVPGAPGRAPWQRCSPRGSRATSPSRDWCCSPTWRSTRPGGHPRPGDVMPGLARTGRRASPRTARARRGPCPHVHGPRSAATTCSSASAATATGAPFDPRRSPQPSTVSDAATGWWSPTSIPTSRERRRRVARDRRPQPARPPIGRRGRCGGRVGAPGVVGVHQLARLLRDLIAAGIPAERILPWSTGPGLATAARRAAHALAHLAGPAQSSSPLRSPFPIARGSTR